MPTSAVTAPVTLADLLPLPGARARSAALVIVFAAATAAGAQITIDLNVTPVPITAQTFAVLLSGAVLGCRLGTLSQMLYVAAGIADLPVFSRGEHGWDAATGWRAGYLVGFVAAAAVVGMVAERGKDRSLRTSIGAMLAGTGVIYLFGITWYAHWSGIALYDRSAGTDAFREAVRPFLVGDLCKLLLAASVLPLAWRLHARAAREERR